MKITYEDKESINILDLPNKNKVTDNDMNEIKEVVNKNAGTLLWTNPNPTSGMASETNIPLDLSNYSAVAIIFKVNASDDNSRYIERTIDVGYRTSVDHVTPYANQASVVIRQRTLTIETTGITSDLPTKHTLGQITEYTAPDNDSLIPYKIYGIG